MNTYQALQRVGDGRWDYTRNAQPTGYCREYIEYTPEFIERHNITDEELIKHESLKHKYHTDGHATLELALECYKNYCLDNLTRRTKQRNQMSRCLVCKEFTVNLTEVDFRLFVLCDQHDNIEQLKELFKAPKLISSSY